MKGLMRTPVNGPMITFNRNSLFREMDRFFDDLMAGDAFSWGDTGTRVPAADLEETDHHVLVMLDVPGVKKDDIHLEVIGNRLHVSAERKEEKKEERKEGGYRMTERRYGRWERYFLLPETVDTHRVEANYADGVLKIALPKVEAAKPRLIKISDGKAA